MCASKWINKKNTVLSVVIILSLSGIFMSGCLDDPDGEIGIPTGAEDIGYYHEDENKVEFNVPIHNRYDEAKNTVAEFVVTTFEENRHSEIKMLNLPADSEEEYTHFVDIPEDEEASDIDFIIQVWEDETKILNVSGGGPENPSLINVTIANTFTEQKSTTIEYEIETEVENFTKSEDVKIPDGSIEEYSQKFEEFEDFKEYLFSLSYSEYEDHLEEGPMDENLTDAFEEEGYELDDEAELSEEEGEWTIIEGGEDVFTIKRDEDELNIFFKDMPDPEDIEYRAKLK